LSVTVTTSRTGTLSTRTKYLRTDAATEYYLWVNSHWVVYHPPTSHFFVTDPFSNSVIVLDSVTEKQIAKISVPGAYGIDDTPDHSTLYVGTLIGDIYTIDPVTMKVTRRYLASEIGPYGYQALVALVLSDGRLALLGQQGGIPSVDGSSGIAIWSPTNNAISMYGSSNAAGAPTSPLCGSVVGLHIFGFALTRDRTSILTGDGNGLCELNASTGQSQSTALNGNSGSISTSPDGRYLAFPIYPNAVSLYDAHTLTQVAQFSVAGDTSSASDLLFSADSKTLFVPSSSFVYAYDVATHQQIGWLPNIVVEYTSGGLAVGPATNPIFAVTDNTGLLVGPLEEGFGFLDTTALQTGPVGTAFANNFLTPDTGPVTGGTQVQFSVPPAVNAQSNIYFGTTLVPAISTSGTLATVTTPAGQPGPADVYIFSNDGGMQLVPDGFSYGPTILEVTPDRSSAEGGGVGVIYGYGFMAANATQIPPDLSVKVGGNAVTILGGSPNAYGVEPIPFLLQSVSYTIPPGSAGSAVDVSVTTASGTATVSGVLIYLPSLKQFPLAGASLAQGVYDPVRDLYYFTDASKVQVFSLSQNKWLAPISIPAPSGATQRLWGISLSPDASKIAIADAQAGVVYLVDPTNTASVKTFSVTPSPPNGTLVLPAGVAITDSGVIYIADDVQGGTGYSNFYKLDTTTGVLTNLFLTGPGGGASDLQLRTVVSADNSRAYFNVLGDVVAFDTATNAMFQASVGQGCCYGDYDLTLSPNQTQLEGTGYLFDSDLNGAAAFALNDREVLNVSYVYGAKFSPDGSLLFQPATQGMDIYDGRTGTLRTRLAFSIPLSPNYDALVSDGKDNILVAITGTTGAGVAIVDLSSIPEPAPLPYIAAAANPSRAINMRNSERSDASANRRPKEKKSAAPPHVIPHVTNPNLLRPR
jgi:YVTN family beta-propeller protein